MGHLSLLCMALQSLSIVRMARTKIIRNKRSLEKCNKWHWELMVMGSSQRQVNYPGGLDPAMVSRLEIFDLD